MIPEKNPNQGFFLHISNLFPFRYLLEFTLKNIGHIDSNLAVKFSRNTTSKFNLTTEEKLKIN